MGFKGIHKGIKGFSSVFKCFQVFSRKFLSGVCYFSSKCAQICACFVIFCPILSISQKFQNGYHFFSIYLSESCTSGNNTELCCNDDKILSQIHFIDYCGFPDFLSLYLKYHLVLLFFRNWVEVYSSLGSVDNTITYGIPGVYWDPLCHWMLKFGNKTKI